MTGETFPLLDTLEILKKELGLSRSVTINNCQHSFGIIDEDAIFLSKISGEIDESDGESKQRVLTVQELVNFISRAGLELGSLDKRMGFYYLTVNRRDKKVGVISFQ